MFASLAVSGAATVGTSVTCETLSVGLEFTVDGGSFAVIEGGQFSACGGGVSADGDSNLLCDGDLRASGRIVGVGATLTLPTYANNAAAILGGLTVNQLYKVVTGEVRVVV